MSRHGSKWSRWVSASAAALGAIVLCASSASAQTPIPYTQAVGGVKIGDDGALVQVPPAVLPKLIQLRNDALHQAPGDMNQPCKLRVVSLRGLQSEIELALKTAPGKPLPDSIRYVAGLQRVQYVFVDTDRHDILIAGPADGWKVSADGEIVGKTSGRPVLLLDDLLVALRGTEAASRGGIFCSIDPTPEGIQRLQDFNRQQTNSDNLDAKLTRMEQLLGLQTIRVGGISDTSHFALVMVSADYQMKRLGMHLDKSPVKGLPSYLEMAPAVQRGGQPRWWLTADYEPLGKDPQGLTWEIRGQGVKCQTEDSYFTSTGQSHPTGQKNRIAEKWAELMTSKYGELCDHQAIFAELRNCMDLALVSTLISREHLAERAGCQLDLLMDGARLPLEKYNVPKQVASTASLLRKGTKNVIAVSGGVKFQPWELTTPENQKVDEAVDHHRAGALQAAKSSTNWWSN